MNAKGWMLSAGLGAAAGAVAVLMMPRQNPVRRVAAKAANNIPEGCPSGMFPHKPLSCAFSFCRRMAHTAVRNIGISKMQALLTCAV